MSYVVVSDGNGGKASLLFPPASFSKVDSMNSVISLTTIEEALLAKVARFPNALILSTSSEGGSLLLPLSLSFYGCYDDCGLFNLAIFRGVK